jgi:hypothetical protein
VQHCSQPGCPRGLRGGNHERGEDWDFVFQPACVSESLEEVQGGGQMFVAGGLVNDEVFLAAVGNTEQVPACLVVLLFCSRTSGR